MTVAELADTFTKMYASWYTPGLAAGDFMEIGKGGGEMVLPKSKPDIYRCDYCGSYYKEFQTNCVNCGAPIEPKELLRIPRGDGYGDIIVKSPIL